MSGERRKIKQRTGEEKKSNRTNKKKNKGLEKKKSRTEQTKKKIMFIKNNKKKNIVKLYRSCIVAKIKKLRS